MMRNPPRWPPQPPPPNRPLPTGWRALLIGIAFGFSAGFLFTIGIIALTNANSIIETQPPVGNGAISASATSAPTPTPTPTFTATPSPTPSPMPSPTPTPTPGGGSGQLLAPDDPAFYITVLIIFLVLSAFLLLRKK